MNETNMKKNICHGRGIDLRLRFSLCNFVKVMLSLLLVLSATSVFSLTTFGQETNQEIGTVNSDAIFYSSDNLPIGKLFSGTEIFISSVENGKVFFQWNDTFAWIMENDINIVQEIDETNLPFIFSENDSSQMIKTNGNTVIFEDVEMTKQLASIESEEPYFIQNINLENYEISFANRTGFINKDTATVLVNQQDQQSLEDDVLKPEAPTSSSKINTNTILNETLVNSTIASPESTSVTKNFDKYFKPTSGKIPVYRANSSDVIAELLIDKEYIRVSDAGDWHLVKVGNEYGYVWKAATVPTDGTTIKNASKGEITQSKKFIATNDIPVLDISSGRIEYITLKKGQKYQFIDEDPYWYKVDILGRVGYVNKSGTKQEFLGNENYFKVSTDKLAVYRENSNVVIAELKIGQVYPRVADAGDWHLVRVGKEYGYVLKDPTQPDDGSSIKNVATNFVSTGKYFETTMDMPAIDTTNGRTDYITLKKGIRYEILDEDPYWYKVNLLDRVGYVNKYGTKREFMNSDKFFKVNVDKLEVYPENNKDAIMLLTKGQEYQRVADAGDWHLIKIGNKYGYVWKAATEPSSGDSIKNLFSGEPLKDQFFNTTSDVIVYDTSVNPKAPFGLIKSGKQIIILEEYEDWYKVDVLGRIGFVNKSGTRKDFKVSDKYFKVQTDKLPVYVNRGNTSIIVAELSVGQEYLRIADAGDWHLVKVGSEYGYVWESSTEPSNGKTIDGLNNGIQPGTYLFLTLKDTTVISGSRKPIGSIKEGEKYPILNIYADHYEIDILGRIGYVLKSDVQVGPIIRYTYYSRTLEDQLNLQMQLNPQTDKYRNEKAYVSSEFIKISSTDPTVGIVTTSSLNIRKGPSTDYDIVSKLKMNDTVKIVSNSNGWYEIKITWKNAYPDDVKYYLDPNNFGRNSEQFYQYLVLSESAGINVNEVNQKILAGKGILEGKANAFYDASVTHGINEIYLISHALLETGNGSSLLAKGIKYNGVTVYNMYGIGAYDVDPINLGAKFAYENGWFTPEASIIGGAKFVAENYIHAGQDTLYEMKWNPGSDNLLRNPHQYASDIGWAYKQVYSISNLYSMLNSYIQIFDVPVYK